MSWRKHTLKGFIADVSCGNESYQAINHRRDGLHYARKFEPSYFRRKKTGMLRLRITFPSGAEQEQPRRGRSQMASSQRNANESSVLV